MAPIDFIIAYENGELDEADTIAGFQELINSGIVWNLQGSYGRIAMSLIEQGICTPRDYRPATDDESSDWLYGYLRVPGAKETEEGVFFPVK